MEMLSVKDVAALKGCSVQYIKKLALNNDLPHVDSCNANGKKKYLFPLDALDPALQRKWYKQQGLELPPELQSAKPPAPPKTIRPLEFFSKTQREEIDRWTHILERWRRFRDAHAGTAAEADKAFLTAEGLTVSVKTLERRWLAYKNQDWEGLVDNRGRANKGKTTIPQEIRDMFEYFYLDQHAINIRKCYELTGALLKERRPDLLDQLPSYHTMYRWAKDIPLPIACLAREGDKAFNDKCGVYVDRLYDDMESNDYWIADGHRLDVITKSEDGRERQHRMALTAFIDARSGIFVGWVITENFSSDATLLALRKAIMRYGIPRYIYVDNGREYLNHDIGGMGHRARKGKERTDLPTPILSRLGITMTNALPRNAQAKKIERDFQNVAFLASLFDTGCGSNVVVKPERLKYYLREGKLPTDSELYTVLEAMIEGDFNCRPYGGKVVADRGKPKIEVYKENLHTVRKAAAEDLNLMMMRSSRLQTVGRNGVYVTVGGEKIFYYDDELRMMQGKKVFVRHDPEAMGEVRVYDENEVFIKKVPMRSEIILSYFSAKEDIGKAAAERRRCYRKAKEDVNAIRERVIRQYGHINALDLLVRVARINREGLLVTDPTAGAKVMELVRAEERLAAATGTDGGVVIDRGKMIQNNEMPGR